MVDLQDPAEPADAAKALEKLQAAHFALRAEGLVRWTLADIPPEVQEAYVLIGAYLGADEFGAAARPDWWLQGLRMVQTHVHVPLSGASYVENF